MSLQGILKKSCSDIIVGQVGSSKLTSLIEPGDKSKHWISKIKTKESSASRLLNQTSRFGTCSMIKWYAVVVIIRRFHYQQTNKREKILYMDRNRSQTGQCRIYPNASGVTCTSQP